MSAHIDPMDDDTPASNSHEAEAMAFTEDIGKVLKTTTVPSPNSRNQIHSMVPTLTNSALSSYSANSTSKIAKIYLRRISIRSIMSYPI